MASYRWLFLKNNKKKCPVNYEMVFLVQEALMAATGEQESFDLAYFIQVHKQSWKGYGMDPACSYHMKLPAIID